MADPDWMDWVKAANDGNVVRYERNTEELYDDDIPIVRERKRDYLYPHRETAWWGEYEIRKNGPVWTATCNNLDGKCDGKDATYSNPSKARTMDQVEMHIMRHGRPPRPQYVVPKECPY